jgi:hypothetical protein
MAGVDHDHLWRPYREDNRSLTEEPAEWIELENTTKLSGPDKNLTMWTGKNRSAQQDVQASSLDLSLITKSGYLHKKF